MNVLWKWNHENRRFLLILRTRTGNQKSNCGSSNGRRYITVVDRFLACCFPIKRAPAPRCLPYAIPHGFDRNASEAALQQIRPSRPLSPKGVIRLPLETRSPCLKSATKGHSTVLTPRARQGSPEGRRQKIVFIALATQSLSRSVSLPSRSPTRRCW